MKKSVFCLLVLLASGCGASDEGGPCEVEGRWELSYVALGHDCALEPEVLTLRRDDAGEWAPSFGPRAPGEAESESLSSYFFYDSEACAVVYEADVGWTAGAEAISDSRQLELSFEGESASGTLKRGGGEPCLSGTDRSYEVHAQRL